MKTYTVEKSGKGFRVAIVDMSLPECFRKSFIGGERSRRFYFTTAEAAQVEADKAQKIDDRIHAMQVRAAGNNS